ncbi:MAG: hypothetical protein EOO09_04305 [Chitinophagaceae bacterium]|nr:MAG: hypothetical protein EOO09_04305 [Chitinophagaceae bacterium]
MLPTSKYLLLPALLSCTAAFSQNSVSPYSSYGIGEIDNGYYNRSSGMANTGMAISSPFFMVDNNPAAIAALPKSFFLLSAGTAGRTTRYRGDAIGLANSNAKDFWIKRLGLTFKMTDHWASGIGFRQFSNINYQFAGTKPVEGANLQYAAIYQGDGGLNEYYWNNAVSLGKHFSIGVKSSIIAGSVNRTESVSDEALTTVIETRQQDYYGNARFQFGAQYNTTLGKKWGLSLGGKYIPKTLLNSERTITVSENSTVISEEESVLANNFSLPQGFSAGFALKKNNRNTYAVDYTYDDWSALGLKGTGWQMTSAQRLSAGVEFAKQVYMGSQYAEKRFFQLGVFASDAYLQVSNQLIREYGFTAGVGGAVNSTLLYNIAAEVGSRGTTRAKLIRENYVQVTIALSFRDFLQSKGRKYD